MRETVDSVCYDNMDGAAIKEASDNMKDFDIYGLATVIYKDRPIVHRGTKMAVYEVMGSKVVRVTDWQEVLSQTGGISKGVTRPNS